MSNPIKQIKQEVQSKISGYIVAALGLVAGLAWNDAVKALIDFFYPAGGGNSLVAKFIYAVLLTIIVVIITLLLTRAMERRGEK